MRPWRICSPSTANSAGSSPARLNSSGRTLGASGALWTAMKTAAGSACGIPCTNSSRAGTPPAEAPITTMSRRATPSHRADLQRPSIPLGGGRPGSLSGRAKKRRRLTEVSRLPRNDPACRRSGRGRALVEPHLDVAHVEVVQLPEVLAEDVVEHRERGRPAVALEGDEIHRAVVDFEDVGGVDKGAPPAGAVDEDRARVPPEASRVLERIAADLGAATRLAEDAHVEVDQHAVAVGPIDRDRDARLTVHRVTVGDPEGPVGGRIEVDAHLPVGCLRRGLRPR